MKTAARHLLKKPGFSLLVIFALALGLGANTAVFSVVNGVLLKPLPFEESENLVIIRDTKLPQFPEFSIAPGNFLDWQTQSTAFESMAAWSNARFNLIEGGDPESLRGVFVTASLLPTLRVKPMLGRVFSADEEQEGRANVVILSHRLWQRRFGSDPAIVGRNINLNAQSYTIVGVMPPKQEFPNNETDLWAPLAINASMRANHGSHYMGAVARLKNGTSIEKGTAELVTIARRLEETYPDSNKGWSVKVISLIDRSVGDIRRPLLILLGAVVFVLLIACANVANLLLVRSNARQREMAIRIAIGANRRQVIRQVLAESLLLSVLGGAAGIAIAKWGIDALLALAPQVLPRAQEIGMDGTVLAFTLLMSVATGLIFGMIPAVQASKPNLNDTLKEGSRGASSGQHRQRIRNILVVAEVALSLILLVGAGLLIRSFSRLQNVNTGFVPKNAIAIALALPQQKFPDDDDRRRFVDRSLAEISSIPGIETVGVSHAVPLVNDYVVSVLVEGRPKPGPGERISTNYYAVTSGYFKAMGISLKRGRSFTPQDAKDSPRVAVVSESFAKRIFPGEDPIGKRVNLTQGPDAWREIIGIVGDVKQYGLDQETTLQAYEPYAHMPFSSLTFVIRTTAEPSTLFQTIRSRIRTIDKDQPLTSMRLLADIVSDSTGQRRFSVVLLTAFAGVALVLATVGLYGVMAYLVTQRTHEIGLRMALGAPRANVFRLIVGQGLVLTTVGVVIGLAGAFVLTRLMSAMLYETSTTDPLTFVSISIALAVVSLFASYLPARRAMKVDPIIALRYE